MPALVQTLHPSSIVVGVLLASAAMAYASWWRRLRAGHQPEQVRWRHAVLFGSGLTVLAFSLAGPLDWIGEQRLMAGHMVQHLVVFSVAPALLLTGIPRVSWPQRILHASAPAIVRTTTLCAIAGLAAIWLLHVPAVLDAGVRSPALNDLQHLPLLLAGLALAWPLAGPRPIVGLLAVAFLGVISLGVGVLGIWLTWIPQVVYESYLEVPRLWGLSAKTDQSLAGAILLVVDEPFVAIEVAILFIRALGAQDDEGADS